MRCPDCYSHRTTVVGDNILCLSCGKQDYLYDYRNAYDEGGVTDNTELETLQAQVNDLEATIAEPGQIPRQYSDRLNQLRGEVAYLRNKVNEVQRRREKMYDKYA